MLATHHRLLAALLGGAVLQQHPATDFTFCFEGEKSSVTPEIRQRLEGLLGATLVEEVLFRSPYGTVMLKALKLPEAMLEEAQAVLRRARRHASLPPVRPEYRLDVWEPLDPRVEQLRARIQERLALLQPVLVSYLSARWTGLDHAGFDSLASLVLDKVAQFPDYVATSARRRRAAQVLRTLHRTTPISRRARLVEELHAAKTRASRFVPLTQLNLDLTTKQLAHLFVRHHTPALGDTHRIASRQEAAQSFAELRYRHFGLRRAASDLRAWPHFQGMGPAVRADLLRFVSNLTANRTSPGTSTVQGLSGPVRALLELGFALRSELELEEMRQELKTLKPAQALGLIPMTAAWQSALLDVEL